MLSRLQQYILEECVITKGGGISRRVLDTNFQASHSRAQEENFKKIITQSIERLIDRGFLTGYGTKTKEKLFIEKIKLTAAGKRQAEKSRRSRQIKLPLHASSKN